MKKHKDVHIAGMSDVDIAAHVTMCGEVDETEQNADQIKSFCNDCVVALDAYACKTRDLLIEGRDLIARQSDLIEKQSVAIDDMRMRLDMVGDAINPDATITKMVPAS